jgi:uncharacterized RDD family membrane protein YckC
MTGQHDIPQAEQAAKKKPRKDPRTIVTPDAFSVSETVLGKPLATPKRRGLAMFIDLLIIQQLSHISSFLLGLALAGVLFLLGSQKKQKAVGSGIGRFFNWLGIVIIVAVIAYEIFLYQSDNNITLLRDRPEPVVTEHAIDESLPLEQQLVQAKERIEELEERDTDLIELIEQIAEQFGYGFGWAAVYFTLCLYLLNGQTIGKFLCRIRVVQLDGKKIGIWSAFGRYGGYAASFVTGLSGFFQIYWDANRQGLHDKVSGTVVICLRRAKKQGKLAEGIKTKAADLVVPGKTQSEQTESQPGTTEKITSANQGEQDTRSDR